MPRFMSPRARPRLWRPVASLAFLLLLASLATPAAGTSFVMISDEALADTSEIIARVRVLAHAPASVAGRPYTSYRLQLDEVAKGAPDSDVLSVSVPGGVAADGAALKIWGAPELRIGESAILFLDRGRAGWRINHLMLGAFRTVEIDGRELAVRNLAETVEVTRTEEELTDAPISLRRAREPRDAERFVAWIRDRATGKRRQPDYFVEPAPDVALAITQQFTLFEAADGLNIRWQEFDRGEQVEWHIARRQRVGIAGGGKKQLVEALEAWSEIGNINLVFAARRNLQQTGFGGNDGFNVALMEDPNDEISAFSCNRGGVLAVGGPWFFPGRTHDKRGKEYVTAIEADIVFNGGLRCVFQASPDRKALLAEIFAHELGHTLGLGHSCGDDRSPACGGRPRLDDALMRATVHDDGLGPRITRDDRKAALRPRGMRYKGVDAAADSDS